MEITVTYQAVDGFRQKRSFKTLAGARKFAHKGVGARPDVGSYYAVSFDGIGRITVEGANLADLFPETVEPVDLREHVCEQCCFNGFGGDCAGNNYGEPLERY